MPFVLKQSDAFINSNSVPASLTNPLGAHIAGGHAKLHRYGATAEKENISLGAYNSAVDTTYAWPDRTAGSLIDQDYFKLFIDDALLRYFQDLVSADSTITPVSGYKNRVKSSGVTFKKTTNGAGTTFNRSSILKDRDVQVNDIVDVSAVVSGTPYSLRTYVQDVIAGDNTVAAVTAAATGDAANKSTQAFSESVSKVGGPDNCVTVDIDGSAYDGLQDGDISETYTIEVIQGSTGGNFTTARLKVTSASGNDNQASVTPAAAASPTNIGTRGLQVTFDVSINAGCQSDAAEDGVSDSDLVAGQKWEATVNQGFTAPTATSSGTYTGTKNMTYIIEVAEGGLYTETTRPTIKVTTNIGIDSATPVIVTSSGVPANVGSFGVAVAFNQTALCKGDKYYIVVTAKTDGANRTLVLGHNMPDAMLTATDMNLKLYLKKDGLLIPKNRVSSPPTVNYSLTDTELTVNDGIDAYDDSLTDGGVTFAVPVVEGELFAEYREWLTTYNDKIGSAVDLAEVSSELGTIDPDNPLAFGVAKAVENANGKPVYYTSVSDPKDTSAWQNVLDVISFVSNIYHLVPLTFDPEILELYLSHVEDQSTTEAQAYRTFFGCLAANETKTVLDASKSTDGAEILATLSDNPDASGTQYTLVQVPAGNAKFVTNGVAAGDIFRYLFTTDGFGTTTYTDFVVASVVNEDALLLKTGHTVAVATAQKCHVLRNLTKSALATDLLARKEDFESDRVRLVWPDQVQAGGKTVDGYFAAAAIAAALSAVAPHHPYHSTSISGFDGTSRNAQFFNNSNLRALELGGFMVVDEATDGTIYVRRSVTTDGATIDTREEVSVRSGDAIRFAILAALAGYIGHSTTAASVLRQMEVDASSAFNRLIHDSGLASRLGSMVTSFTDLSIRQHATVKDHAVLSVTLERPAPLNALDLLLVL